MHPHVRPTYHHVTLNDSTGRSRRGEFALYPGDEYVDGKTVEVFWLDQVNDKGQEFEVFAVQDLCNIDRTKVLNA